MMYVAMLAIGLETYYSYACMYKATMYTVCSTIIVIIVLQSSL